MWKRPRPSASAFFTAKNVELFGLYPIGPYLIIYNRCFIRDLNALSRIEGKINKNEQKCHQGLEGYTGVFYSVGFDVPYICRSYNAHILDTCPLYSAVQPRVFPLKSSPSQNNNDILELENQRPSVLCMTTKLPVLTTITDTTMKA